MRVYPSSLAAHVLRDDGEVFDFTCSPALFGAPFRSVQRKKLIQGTLSSSTPPRPGSSEKTDITTTTDDGVDKNTPSGKNDQIRVSTLDDNIEEECENELPVLYADDWTGCTPPPQSIFSGGAVVIHRGGCSFSEKVRRLPFSKTISSSLCLFHLFMWQVDKI
mgnify:CR=1 FL=1